MSNDFAVRCTDCAFTWNTPAMAEGLRVLGACPKCRGALEFGDRAAAPAPIEASAAVPADAAPHMVLGIPRL